MGTFNLALGKKVQSWTLTDSNSISIFSDIQLLKDNTLGNFMFFRVVDNNGNLIDVSGYKVYIKYKKDAQSSGYPFRYLVNDMTYSIGNNYYYVSSDFPTYLYANTDFSSDLSDITIDVTTGDGIELPVTIELYAPTFNTAIKRLKGQGIIINGSNANRITGIDYNGLGGNFYAPESPITAESYASLIENANNVSGKSITMSTTSTSLFHKMNNESIIEDITAVTTLQLTSYSKVDRTITGTTTSTGTKKGIYMRISTEAEELFGKELVVGDTYILDVDVYSDADSANVNYWDIGLQQTGYTKVTYTSGEVKHLTYEFVYQKLGNDTLCVYLDYGTPTTGNTLTFTNIFLRHKDMLTTANDKGFSICTTFNSSNSSLELGTFSSETGEETDKDNRVRTIGYLNYSSFVLKSESKTHSRYILFFYGSDDSFVSNNSWQDIDVGSKISVSYPEGATKFRVVLVSSSILDYTIENADIYTILPALKCDGSHYVDTGINATSDIRFTIDFSNGSGWCFGSNNTSSDVIRYIRIRPRAAVGTDLCIYNSSNINPTLIVKSRHLVGRVSDTMVTIDGENIELLSYQQRVFDNERSMYIGALHGDTSISCFTGSIYSCTIDDNLYIPANNGSVDGMLNMTTLEFLPLMSV